MTSARRWLASLLLATLFSGSLSAAPRESLDGYYAREGNNGSPAEAAGNNIYIRFYPQRWLAVLYLPWPYAREVDDAVIPRVFDAARAQATSSAYLRGTFGELRENATLHIERYGYLEDKVVFECGALSPCTVRFGDGFLEVNRPGVINEHIVRYRHVTGQ